MQCPHLSIQGTPLLVLESATSGYPVLLPPMPAVAAALLPLLLLLPLLVLTLDVADSNGVLPRR